MKRIRIRMKANDAMGLARAFKSYLSRRGIFIKSGSMIPQGTKVVVELLYANGERALYGEGQVAWARQDGPTGSGLNIELDWDAASQTLVDQIIAMPLLSKPPEKAAPAAPPPPSGRRASTASRGIPPPVSPPRSPSAPAPRMAPPIEMLHEPPTSPGLTPPPRRELDITDEASKPRGVLQALRSNAAPPPISDGMINEPLTDAAAISMPPDTYRDLPEVGGDDFEARTSDPGLQADLQSFDSEAPQTEEDPAMLADEAPSGPPPPLEQLEMRAAPPELGPPSDAPPERIDATQPMAQRAEASQEEPLAAIAPSEPAPDAPKAGLFGWLKKKLGGK